jgi:hypothetical protein
MYEGELCQIEPWEESSLEKQREEVEAEWDKMVIQQLVAALRRVLQTGVNGGTEIRLALSISKHGQPLSDEDNRLADASEAAVEAARMALYKAGSVNATDGVPVRKHL